MTPKPRQRWEESWRAVSSRALDAARRASSLEELEAVRLEFLGRKGTLNALLRDLKDLPLQDRRALGEPANALRRELEGAIGARKAALESGERDKELGALRLDLSLPGTPAPRGRLHPLTRTLDEICAALARLGFSLAEGPNVEDEQHNFGALNIPAEHPARDLQDTFYLDAGPGGAGSSLLRTHTSPVQIRTLMKLKERGQRPPLRIMAPGRVFRHEAVDASHSAVFHQVEGLYVDRRVSLADLKGTLRLFLQSLFGPDIETRFRPSYYPFTEPSADVELRCIVCGGSGCPVCKRSGWLEVMGSGLVHSKVLQAVGLDPEEWSGFAFGMGVERIAMLRLKVNDIRLFYQNDARFLEQFG